MKVFVEKENKEKDLSYSGDVIGLLKKLKINPETVLVVKGNTLLTDKDKVTDKDKIRILSVVSGG